MTVVLANQVKLYGNLRLLGKPALLELHDNDRLTLTTFNEKTGARIDTVLDVALADLTVRGEASTLSLQVSGVKTRIDFSMGAGLAFAAGGAIGLAISAAEAKPAIQAWLDALRSRGAQVKFRKSSLPILLAVMGGLILIVIVIAFLV